MANGRPPYRSHVQESESDSESESSESDSESSGDEQHVQLSGDPEYFTPFHSGQLGAKEYERVVPARFSADSDDIFMRSMHENYALELK